MSGMRPIGRRRTASSRSRGRDLTRISDKFATIYLAGCLAIRFKILPFTEAELLAALSDLRARPRGVHRSRAWRGAGTSRLSAWRPERRSRSRPPVLAPSVPATTPFDRLRRFINRQQPRRGFIDLRSPGLSRLAFKLQLVRCDRRARRDLGYVGSRRRKDTGSPAIGSRKSPGPREAAALKKELVRRRAH